MTKVKQFKTNFLFPRASVMHGFGSIFNVAGNYFDFNYSESGEEADKKAIENDWRVIGNDIRGAISKMEKELIQ
jgi:hypothetical protein